MKTKKKKRKLKIGRIIIALILIFLIVYLLHKLIKFPIKNIYISGNTTIKDQEIIDIAGIRDYPSILKYMPHKIESKLKKNILIKKAKVKYKNFKEVYIEIEENHVLFYNSISKKTVLSDGMEYEEKIDGPLLINYVPDKVYKKLISGMQEVDRDIINRISEIKYDPSKVDKERFIFTMSDGNYVYITLDKIKSINNYVKISLEIINKFGKKNGLLNLDAGEYFEIFKD